MNIHYQQDQKAQIVSAWTPFWEYEIGYKSVLFNFAQSQRWQISNLKMCFLPLLDTASASPKIPALVANAQPWVVGSAEFLYWSGWICWMPLSKWLDLLNSSIKVVGSAEFPYQSGWICSIANFWIFLHCTVFAAPVSPAILHIKMHFDQYFQKVVFLRQSGNQNIANTVFHKMMPSAKV